MRRSRLLVLALLIGTLTACAGQAPGQEKPSPPPQAAAPPQGPEEALRARATRFWEARVKGDLVTQYELLEPAVRLVLGGAARRQPAARRRVGRLARGRSGGA